MSSRLWITLITLAAASVAAQSPFDVGRVYGLSGLSRAGIFAVERDGTLAAFSLTTTGFSGFEGLEFDAPRNRVVFIAEISGNRRIGSVDASLDPASVAVLRNGLGADARQVDVDPATGRIYWWESGQILSVNSAGNGTPVLEADGVPEPFALEVDAERGTYLGTNTSASQLFAGPLDPAVPPTTFDPISSGGFVNVFDVAIDSISGDFVWIESVVSSTSGAAAGVIRSDSTFGDPTVIVGTTVPSIAAPETFTGVSVIGDVVAVVKSPFGTAPGTTELRVVNTTSGDVDTVAAPELFSLDAEAIIDPIVTQPESVIVDAGQTAEVSVESLDAAPSYQWFKAGSPLTDDGRISGATTQTLVVASTELTDTDLYACRVITSAGEQQFSDPVILAVRGDAPIPDCPADQNFDGILSPADFNGWIINYNAGCP